MKLKSCLIIGGEGHELVRFIDSLKDLKMDLYFINLKHNELKTQLDQIGCGYRLICSTAVEIIEQTEDITFNAVLFMSQSYKRSIFQELEMSEFILDYTKSILKSMEILKVLVRSKHKIKNSSILFILNNENIGAYNSLNNSIKVLVEYASIELHDLISKIDYIYWDYKLGNVTRDLNSLLESKITLFNRKLN